MKVLYFDLGMGVAGDMLTAALYELLDGNKKKEFIDKINKIFVDKKVAVSVEKSVKCGITGTHFRVIVDGEEEHSHDHHHEDDHDDHENFHEHEGHDHHHHDDHDHHDDYDHEHSDHDDHEHYHDHDHHHDDYDHHHEHHDHEEHDHEHHHHDHDHDHEHHHHHHTSMQDIRDMVGEFDTSREVKDKIIAVYNLIAEAESSAHGRTVEGIHFHEVGTMDAVADITSVCILMDMIKPDKVVVSPIATGFGKVHCMHGILPVPAPATAFILKGIPVYSGRIEGELCTPTGAALIKTFADEFGNMPVMVTERIGYGMGKKNFEAANCVRVMLGEELKNNTCASNQNDVLTDPEFHVSAVDHADRICTLECNIDDMTGEEIGFATDELMKCGARDVFTIPINMKKGRPGILLSVICSMEDKDKMVRNIFRLTSTIGIRQKICERYVLDRKIEKKNTPYGEVSIKRVSGYGIERSKVEYEDLKRIAETEGISVSDARKLIE